MQQGPSACLCKLLWLGESCLNSRISSKHKCTISGYAACGDRIQVYVINLSPPKDIPHLLVAKEKIILKLV